MTDRPKKTHEGNAGAPPGTDQVSSARARTQWAVLQLANQLKIDLSDENQRNAIITRLRTADSRASETPVWAKIAALYPEAKPKITPRYVQQALNTYLAIHTLTTNSDWPVTTNLRQNVEPPSP